MNNVFKVEPPTQVSGIVCSQELIQEFETAKKKSEIRSFKLEIVNEQIVVTKKINVKENEEEDFKGIYNFLEPKKGCYILYKLDTKNTEFRNEWTFLSYIGEGTKVKEQMKYTSAKNNCQEKLGLKYFVIDLYGSSVNEFKFEMIQEARKPSSVREETLQFLTENEIIRRKQKLEKVATITSTEYLHSVSFPCSKELKEQFKNLLDGKINFLQIAIKSKLETLETEIAEERNSLQEIFTSVNKKTRYIFWVYNHLKFNKPTKVLLFFYVCFPKGSIKKNILYSTVKSSLLSQSQEAGIEPYKKYEVTEINDITEEFLFDELYPQKKERRKPKRFTKPKRPGRGKRKLIKKKK
ncbi:twinfilin [Anaeramoeba flamelloides]|uniref:Twinfilin n=1 Tax=Anaeramoeba flamelloides TaxID=1746091 RepID=A0ABQ8Y6E4_9EUKA|nr:twinfilin [Anaeramoeba flamelloides]